MKVDPGALDRIPTVAMARTYVTGRLVLIVTFHVEGD